MSALALAGAMSSLGGCGGSAPVLQGREGMLDEAGVAGACEEAARDHLEPFVVEWDATELSSFEARAAMNTIFVKYEGCDIDVLYGCQKPNERGAFGAYGRPQFTSGSLQGIDIETKNELFAKLPLSALTLGGRVSGGESLSLTYFVSGVATNTRDQITQEEIAAQPGCEGATHFVWAYNLGAFELATAENSSADATVGVGDIGAGVSGSKKKSSLGQGGDLKSCETQDQRACRTPIRLTLRPIGGAPAPTEGGTDGVSAAPPKGAVDESAAMALKSAKDKHEARDGKGCLDAIAQAIGYAPRLDTKAEVQLLRAECLMLDGQCDDGKKAWRETMAAADVKREMSDDLLTKKTRQRSNKLCPASSADNDADRVIRLTHELRAAQQAKDVDQCQAKFNTFRTAYKSLRKGPRPEMSSVEEHAREFGSNAYTIASSCFAEANECTKSKNAFLGQYADMGTPGVTEERMVPIWKNVLKASKIDNCQ